MSRKESSREVVVRQTQHQITQEVCTIFRRIISESVAERKACSLALAGGTTPHALYQALARDCAVDDTPWSDVEVFFGDERDVPQDHVESNYGMVQRTLLDHLPIQPARVHPMPADADDLDAAAADYEQRIREVVEAGKDGIPRFDMILLGMGAEGHTASIFPLTEAATEKKKLVMACFVPVLGRKRMTFTFPLINAARHIILLVTGSDKADVVARILGDDQEAKKSLPAARIAPADGKLIIALDRGAARAAKAAGLKPGGGPST